MTTVYLHAPSVAHRSYWVREILIKRILSQLSSKPGLLVYPPNGTVSEIRLAHVHTNISSFSLCADSMALLTFWLRTRNKERANILSSSLANLIEHDANRAKDFSLVISMWARTSVKRVSLSRPCRLPVQCCAFLLISDITHNALTTH